MTPDLLLFDRDTLAVPPLKETCQEDGCTGSAAPGRTLCWGHIKRKSRGKPGGELAKRPANFERVTEAVHAYSDADDDEEFARARDNLRKAAGAYGLRYHAERTAEGMAAAKARGVHVGRPPVHDRAKVLEAVRLFGGVRAAARAMGMDRRLLQRIIRSLDGGERVPSAATHRTMSPDDGTL